MRPGPSSKMSHRPGGSWETYTCPARILGHRRSGAPTRSDLIHDEWMCVKEALITIIEPRAPLVDTLGPVLRGAGYRVNVVGSPAELRRDVAEMTRLILFDCCAVGPGGAPRIVSEVRRRVPVPILQVSGCHAVDEVCRSHPVRADGFLVRPVRAPVLLAEVSRLLTPDVDHQAFHGMIGRSQAMTDLIEGILRVAPTECTVLVIGETGTGKELVARAIHERSPRRDGPFVPVDCSALPPSLLESELFGHVRGAFTGAVRDKPGLFEISDKGTLFLDEVGDIPAPAQATLLRALQERETRRLGTTAPVSFDTRVVAATRRDLAELVRKRLLREDLYYRLQGYTLSLPPLRERPQDIELLVASWLDGRTGMPCFTGEAMKMLRAYRWPGNVRELFAVLEGAFVRAGGTTPGIEHLPHDLLEAVRTATPDAYTSALKTDGSSGSALAAPAILAALHKAAGNRERAATILGVSRTTLWRRMRSLGLRH